MWDPERAQHQGSSTHFSGSQCHSVHPKWDSSASSVWMQIIQRADLFACIIYVAESWCKAQ